MEPTVLNIRDPGIERAARELAELTGETVTEALREAVRERLARVRAEQWSAPDRLADIIGRGRARVTNEDWTADWLLGFGPDGLPT